MGGEAEESPLLGSSCISDTSEDPLKRTGTPWTAMAHIITGVIGAGVLSLAWSVAHLGWIAGPLSMIAFAAITLVSAHLLCDCYRFPDPEYGPARIRSYMEAVGAGALAGHNIDPQIIVVFAYLLLSLSTLLCYSVACTERSKMVCGVFAQESLYGGGIAYTIASATSARSESQTSLAIASLISFVLLHQ